MKIKSLWVAIVLLTVSASSLSAKSQVGQTIINGELVFLYDDYSWAHSNSASGSTSCRAIHARAQYCQPGTDYDLTVNSGGEISAVIRFDDRNYAQFVIEEVGSAVGYTDKFLRDVIIGNAAEGAGISPQEVTILDISPAEIGSQTAESISLSISINGVPVVFMNTFQIRDDITLQAMNWEIGTTDVTERLIELHQTVLSSTKVDNDD